VTDLRWEKADPTNCDLDACPNNGGKRIFPGKITPDDVNAGLRKQVELVATIEPAIADVMVYFKVWDVDDPFDQLNAGMPDVQLIDGDFAGPDNRGAEPLALPWGASAQTDEDGKARVTFEVSTQPGNNYRAGASVLQDAVNQATQAQADALSVTTDGAGAFVKNGDWSGYSVPLHWSQMLTVWRKLHVEFDSMGAEPETVTGREPDWQNGFVTGVTQNVTLGITILQLSGSLEDNNPHQFEGGRVLVPATGAVHAIYDHDNNNSIDLSGLLTGTEIDAMTGASIVVKDDDPDNGLLPKSFSITQTIKTAYADAYVLPESLASQYNPNTLVPFDLYLSKSDMTLGVGWNNAQDRSSEDTFWVTFVLAAYQAGGDVVAVDARDNDPDPLINNTTYPSGPYWPGPGYEETIQDGWTTTGSEWESIIFRAAIVDFPRQAQYEEQVVAHEIGHSAGNAGTEVQHHSEGGLMSDADHQPGDRFTAQTINRFREAIKW